MENTRDITKECTQEDNTVLNKRIQILMSTYNGEKYLREQLDSFVNLDNFEEVKVLIRDDGSTDSTLEILDEYRLKYGFEIIKGINIGLNKSMMNLFKECDMECDYFAYSDQDDVCLSDKLITFFHNNRGKAIQKAEGENSDDEQPFPVHGTSGAEPFHRSGPAYCLCCQSSRCTCRQ